MSDKDLRDPVRRDLLRMLAAANRRVAGDRAVAAWLAENPIRDECALVALGKAAGAMLDGAQGELGPLMVDGLVVSSPDYLEQLPSGVEFWPGSHPVPDEGSLSAGRAMLDFIARQPPDRRLLFLISGGASSMVEVLRDGLILEDLDRVNRWLLGSGLAIDQMNAVRKSLSRIKGGGLLRHLGERPVTALLISDVPDDNPAVIGSGLLVPDEQIVEVSAQLDLPDWLRALAGTPEISKLRERPSPVLVATNRDARQAAADEAAALGYAVVLHDELLEGDAEETGVRLARSLESARPGIHVWGGETTVRLPEHPGRGGRNQHLALAAAGVFDGTGGRMLLSAGTDGRDGPGEDAGGLVDGTTLERGRLSGLDPLSCLAAAASGEFLEAAGDLVHTGPTGTNVMDLVIGWKA